MVLILLLLAYYSSQSQCTFIILSIADRIWNFQIAKVYFINIFFTKTVYKVNVSLTLYEGYDSLL